MKGYAVTAQILFLLTGVVLGSLVYLLRNRVIGLYNLTDATKLITGQFMTVLAFAQFGRCYQATCLGGLVKAGGDTSFVFKNDTIFVFGVVLPSALLALYVFHAPAWVVYACLQSDQVLKCLVAVVKINRFDWMKNLTRSVEIKQMEVPAELS